jgi:uncharacterized protein (DUF2147 family)
MPLPRIRLLAALLLWIAAGPALAQGAPGTTPAGLWRSVDDNTSKPQALVRITESNGEYTGRIEKLYPGVSEEPNPLCTKCEGARRNQPIVGMVIVSGVRRGPDASEEYSGGEILDPDNGSTYRALLTMADGGRRLRVRGYIGVSLFGRTQVWERVE